VTQPVLFALTDGEHSAVTEGGAAALQIDSGPKGAIVEKRFEIAALERGYEVAVNIGGGRDFDHIIRKPPGRPLVIQEKTGIWTPRQSAYKIYNTARNNKPYSRHAYDVLAAYLPDRKQWLFYTRSEFANRVSTNYQPQEFRKVARMVSRGVHGELMADRNPDNWELLDQVAAMYSQESLGVTQQMSDPILNTP
jgi:hypothetical protein